MNNYYRGLIIVKPHGTFIINKEKTLIIKVKKLINLLNKNLLLIENKKALGIIMLTDIYEVNRNEFEKLRNKHLITDEERIKWWPYKRNFYAYPIKIIKIFKYPIDIDYPQGPQISVTKENVKIIRK